MDDGKTMPFI